MKLNPERMTFGERSAVSLSLWGWGLFLTVLSGFILSIGFSVLITSRQKTVGSVVAAFGIISFIVGGCCFGISTRLDRWDRPRGSRWR